MSPSGAHWLATPFRINRRVATQSFQLMPWQRPVRVEYNAVLGKVPGSGCVLIGHEKFVAAWLMLCATATADPAGYNRDIRPILADKCFACHGPDAAHREAGLRLDQRESATESREGAAAIVPGQPEVSEAMQRILSEDSDRKMPPAESGKTLTPEEISLLSAWISAGAEYQPHWAYVPPQRAEVPAGVSPIDALLTQTFRQQQLSPVEEADRITLIRRVSFDLTGLPPSAAEVDRFLQDADSRAWEHLVDRLLKSPHYGERMAMYWLDLVRFADTVGYHGDQEHATQPYRDYVIRAFNQNKPFDVFTREQLAGDLLAGAGKEQKIASCYNRLLQTSHEGGVQVKEDLTKYESDRVRNLGGVWLGATLGCAECHDHKYDPITQRDFYRFAAVFADVDDLRSFKGGDTNPTKREPEIVTTSPIEQDRAEELNRQIALLEARLISASDACRRSVEESKTISDHWDQFHVECEELTARTYRCMVTEAIPPREIRIRPRGDWLDDSGPVVESGAADWIAPNAVKERRFTRLDLADWLTTRENPLTARVFVNRVWALFFGAGLSRSLDDFGA